MNDLTNLTLAEARDALKSRAISSVELTEAHLTSIERAKALNAFVAVTADHARERARESDARLAKGDPTGAARLRPSDRQRLLRALEVLEATGRPLATFHSARAPPLLAAREWAGLFLAPERALLDARIETRFAAMLRAGALEEVAALARRQLDPALPVMRAHGAPHLIAHLQGSLSLAEAAARAVRDTRQYAKRQFTWARHQMPDFAWVAPEAAEAAGAEALGFR